MIQGKDALVTIINNGGEKKIMCVKSFDVSLLADTLEVTTKGDGKFKSNVYDRYGWTCRLGTVALLDPNVYTGFDMTEAMLRGDVLELFIRYIEGNRTKIFFGKCIIPVSDIVTTPIDFVHNELELLGTGEFVFINESDVQGAKLTVDYGALYTDLTALSNAYIGNWWDSYPIRLLSSEEWDQGVKIRYKTDKITDAASYEMEFLPFVENGVYITSYTVDTIDNEYIVTLTFNYDRSNSDKKIEANRGCRIVVQDVLITPLGSNNYQFTVVVENNISGIGFSYILDGGALSFSPSNTFTVNIPTSGSHSIDVSGACSNFSNSYPFTKIFNTSTCIPVDIIGSNDLPNATNGVAYSHSKSLSGSAPYSLSIASKPSWMSIVITANTITFSGTPTAIGSNSVNYTITNCSGVYSEVVNSTINIVAPTTSTPIESVGKDASLSMVCGSTPDTVYIDNIYITLTLGVRVYIDSALLTNVGEVYLIHYPTGNLWKTDTSGMIVANMGTC